MSSDTDIRAAAAKTPLPEFHTTGFTQPPALKDARAIVTTGGLLPRGGRSWQRGEQSFRVLDARDRDMRMGYWSLNYDRSGFSSI